MAREEVELERVRVIVVDRGAVGVRQVRLRPVVVVLLEEDAPTGRQPVDDGPGDGALSGARAPRDSDDERGARRRRWTHHRAVTLVSAQPPERWRFAPLVTW